MASAAALSTDAATGGGRTRHVPIRGPKVDHIVFFGAKGGAGTTIAVNFGVDIARLRKRRLIVDLKPGLGEVTLFLGVRSRYTLLDALDNLHRLDEFMQELVVKHKSGLRSAGSDLFDRPGSDSAPHWRSSGSSAVVRYILVDAGSQLNRRRSRGYATVRSA